jgi:hypothetical protein
MIMRALPLTGLLSLLLAGSAVAQQPSQAQANAIRQSCSGDYQSLCANVPTGGRASLQCLQEHIGSLSPPCHDAVVAATGASPPATSPGKQAASPPPAMSRRQQAALLRSACGDDFHTYCAGVPMGHGRALGCLMRNETRLSPQCRGALAQAQAAR